MTNIVIQATRASSAEVISNVSLAVKSCLELPGLWPYRVLWIYGGLAMGTFIVRTMKHVLFHDAPHFSEPFSHVCCIAYNI